MLVLCYHDVSYDRSPLAIEPELFSQHLAVLDSCGATVLTASEVLTALEQRQVPERAVALTFDDGFAGAASEGRRRLAGAQMRATFFCVAGHLGGASDWPSRRGNAPVGRLASSDQIALLAREGHEIGSHGWSHAPLDAAADLRRELVESQVALTAATGSEIRTFAYPYGALPIAAAGALVEETYSGAFTTAGRRVTSTSSPFSVPRVDSHYVRDPRVLRSVVLGEFDAYLRARRMGARTRRALRKDYATRAVAGAKP